MVTNIVRSVFNLVEGILGSIFGPPGPPLELPPISRDDFYTTNQNTPLSVPPPGVLANDFDLDGDPLTAILVSGPSNGSVVLNADGSFTYTPNPGFVGTDAFTYQASDGRTRSLVASVTITVNPVNLPPVAQNDMYETTQNTPLAVPAPGVLANDTDPNGDPLSAQLVGAPSNGTVVLNSDGSFVYTPNPAFTGTDTFTYRASDGSALSNVATVSITVSVP
ncbi:cadherin-like domain-containing protein [Paludifilum halophilum]|uniref:Tandem-95 repeat protein n=1 Tax=Paludifilum halophilum TaxID=1642702 RepID=A0A235BDK4_9BACL|nr:cadherin-like domain-containing protein [Paludifilum halophilum]OYD09675.1 hypothetical protein CHM34_01325 [Paludifilum halophilum]